MPELLHYHVLKLVHVIGAQNMSLTLVNVCIIHMALSVNCMRSEVLMAVKMLMFVF